MELAVVGVVVGLLLLFGGAGGGDKRARRAALVNELVAAQLVTRDRTELDWLLAHLALLYPQGATREQIEAYVKNRTDLTDALLLTIETNDLAQIARIMRVRGTPVTVEQLRAAMGKVR